MKKRVLVIILALAMILALSATAMAAPATSVTAGGVTLDAANPYATTDQTGVVTLGGDAGSYNLWFDGENAILYLKDAIVTSSDPYAIEVTGDLTIHLSGDNSLTGYYGGLYANYGVGITGSLTIQGPGQLTTGGSSSAYDGIYNVNGDIIVNSGHIIANALGGGGNEYGGLCSENGGIIINNGTVTATAAGKAGYGLCAFGGNMEIHGGTVTAASKDDDGIFFNGNDFIISGGLVTATSISDDGIEIYSGDLTITGGMVMAAGGDRGLLVDGSLTISNGAVTASGGNSAISAGVFVLDNSYPADRVILLGDSAENAEKWTGSNANEDLNDTRQYVKIYRGIKLRLYTAGGAEGDLLTLDHEYPYWVNGASAASASAPADGSGYAYYNVEKGVLELHNMGSQGAANPALLIPEYYPLILELYGNNYLGTAVGNKCEEGIFSDKTGKTKTEIEKMKGGDIYIQEGAANATLYAVGFADGIKANNFTMYSGTVTAEGKNYKGLMISGNAVIYGGALGAAGNGDDYLGDGIHVLNSMAIYGGEITAAGHDGVYIKGDLAIANGTVTATGRGDDDNYSRNGIRIDDGALTISNGTVTATGESNGVFIYDDDTYDGDLTISGGMVTATGQDYEGVYIYYGDLIISGGTLTAKGEGECGVYIEEGNISISNGTVTATGQDYEGVYIYYGDLIISGGTLTAKGEGECGVYIEEGHISISNGTLTAIGDYCALYIDYGTFAFEGDYLDPANRQVMTGASENQARRWTGADPNALLDGDKYVKISPPEPQPQPKPQPQPTGSSGSFADRTPHPQDQPGDQPGDPFIDVKPSDWFYDDVLTAYEDGLINGRTSSTYVPNGSITIAEAIKLAACMHQLYTTGSVTLGNGSPLWYSTYVEYAIANGIITAGQFGDLTAVATRAQFAMIFAKALPEAAYGQLNDIRDGDIPDVSLSDPWGPAVYLLYRAGILRGNDALLTFAPGSDIKRSEVAAIVARMMHPEKRVELDR